MRCQNRFAKLGWCCPQRYCSGQARRSIELAPYKRNEERVFRIDRILEIREA